MKLAISSRQHPLKLRQKIHSQPSHTVRTYRGVNFTDPVPSQILIFLSTTTASEERSQIWVVGLSAQLRAVSTDTLDGFKGEKFSEPLAIIYIIRNTLKIHVLARWPDHAMARYREPIQRALIYILINYSATQWQFWFLALSVFSWQF